MRVEVCSRETGDDATGAGAEGRDEGTSAVGLSMSARITEDYPARCKSENKSRKQSEKGDMVLYSYILPKLQPIMGQQETA